MVYCTKCGTDNAEENTECSNCGTPINPEPRRYRTRDRELEDECFGSRGRSNFPLLFGGFLILIGLSNLLENVIPWFNIGSLWPLFLVGLGLLIMSNGMNKRR